MARRSSGRSKRIDEVNWHGVIGVASALAAGTAAVNLISASLGSFTVMRTRGEWFGSFDTTSGPGAMMQVAMGIWLVPEGTGTTVLGSPISDPNADWFVYETRTLAYEEAVTDVIAYGGVSFRSEIDGKSMRRMKSDMEVQVVYESATLLTTEGVNLSFVGRILLGN